ncbi:DNAI1 [Cordylochernes scorpioides]|uniref:DNAI1 n=1 Tax=Cordylochernes scorpioides TaxID=51811 RepID=A0ABY6KWT8_9ARAC|nr:DNAI1 [Cordylochernes scorpioides]
MTGRQHALMVQRHQAIARGMVLQVRIQYIEPPLSLCAPGEEQGEREEGEEEGRRKRKEENSSSREPVSVSVQGEDLASILNVAKILERMINQNNFDEIALDDFLQQDKGKICIFSLKSPSHPEWVFETEAGVFSLDFHREQPHLMAAGMSDGCVAVFNLRDNRPVPSFYSSDPNTKHYDPVWKVGTFNYGTDKHIEMMMTDVYLSYKEVIHCIDQVVWLDDDLDGNMNFSSVSGDGRVVNWMLVKTELKSTEMLLLKREDCKLEGPEGIQLETISSGTALAVQNDSSLFLVGTEEGLIHKCSTVYTSQYLMTYHGHHLSVYTLAWNPFHPRVFISCSADWLVHIWDHTCPSRSLLCSGSMSIFCKAADIAGHEYMWRSQECGCVCSEPVFTFDLKHKVEDVSWAPYASTVFAAITADGKVHVYDLHFDKHQPICQQSVMLKKKTKPTHLAFNPAHPLLLVGDDRGHVLSLKLSPNLRKNLKEMTKIDPTKLGEVEVAKMEKLLQLAATVHKNNIFTSWRHLVIDDADFKFWEDPADEYRENKGTLLPLWKFTYLPAKLMTVTCLRWNPKYSDLFGVGYGTYDFLQQDKGKICIFSLKSPSHPEWVFETEAGVFSLDFHREQPHLMAAGMSDGCVAVFNLRDNRPVPSFYSSDPNTKHYDPVWKVVWLDDDLDGNMNFSSVSGDGRVVNWMLVKTELKSTEMLLLKREDCKLEGPEGIQLETISSGTALAVQNDSSLFLVGTEEGLIHKCSTVYTSQYLMTYHGHHLSVYTLAWNPFHPRVFISCSADWLVHIWDHTCPEPVFTFDLKHKVEDVSWAPYASTVFAAITADGKVHVYDLHFDKHQPICQQSVMLKKKTKPTHLAFNPAHPLLLVGDDRGHVLSLKLSPNLRKNLKEMTKIDPTKLGEVEVAKMEKLLQLAATVRE